MSEVFFVRRDGYRLSPTNEEGEQCIEAMSREAVYKVTLTRPSERNIQHHRKFFAMIKLAFEYWNPVGGLITGSERNVVALAGEFLEQRSKNSGAITEALKIFIDDLETERAEQTELPEKDIKVFRQKIIIASGYYHLIKTLDGGVEKEADSISFHNMSQDKFDALYRSVRAVCWRLVLSRHYKDQSDMDNAVAQIEGFY